MAAAKTHLEIRTGLRQGERISFESKKTLRIGRDQRADICMPGDSGIADIHVQLDLGPQGCRFRTLDGRPEVLVNGHATGQGMLSHGDILQVGQTKFEYLSVVSDQRNEKVDMESPTYVVPESQTDRDKTTCGVPQRVTADDSKAKLVQIPGFTVVRLIGRGGMGSVYEAIRDADGDRFAIKLLKTVSVDDHDMRMFLREASVLSALNHPKIVRFREVGWADGKIFIAMEYVENIDFRSLLSTLSTSSRIRLACGVIMQVLQALDFAHRKRIVHRDVKPSNILVTRLPGKLQAKLSDFGLAKDFEKAGYSSMTAVGEARGTFVYMAPEQLRESRYVKPAADIYSTGVSLYSYLTNEVPFAFPCPDETRKSLLTLLPTSLGSKVKGIPSELCQIVARAVATEPSERFESAIQMRDALAPFAKSANK